MQVMIGDNADRSGQIQAAHTSPDRDFIARKIFPDPVRKPYALFAEEEVISSFDRCLCVIEVSVAAEGNEP